MGGVVDAEGYRECQREVYRFVGDSFLEVEGVCAGYVGSGEGRAGAVAGRYLGGGGVDEADKCAGDFDRSKLRS